MNDPFAAVLARGATLARERGPQGVLLELGGVALATSGVEATTYVVTLLKPPVPQLAFTKESLRTSLGKLVWPEIQLGEAEFDDVVVARTTTPEATRAFLHDAVARGFVQTLVTDGGMVSVEGAVVRIVIPTASALSDLDAADFVERLLPT